MVSARLFVFDLLHLMGVWSEIYADTKTQIRKDYLSDGSVSRSTTHAYSASAHPRIRPRDI